MDTTGRQFEKLGIMVCGHGSRNRNAAREFSKVAEGLRVEPGPHGKRAPSGRVAAWCERRRWRRTSSTIRRSPRRATETGLFDVVDATGQALGTAGLRRGNVAGSFMHVIDLAAHHER